MQILLSLLLAVLSTGAFAVTPGWEPTAPDARWPEPVEVLWRADLAAGASAFEIVKRNGAEGDVTFTHVGTNAALRIRKTNARGQILVRAKATYAAKKGRLLRARALVETKTDDPENALGFLRLHGRREALDLTSEADRARGNGGPKMYLLPNTATRSPERKLAHFTATDKTGTDVHAALVICGAPSETTWYAWTIEDARAAQKAWQGEIARREAPDRSADRIDEDAFARALAADREHSARVVRTNGLARLVVDGRPEPAIFFKGQHGRRAGKNTFAGRDLQKAGVRLQACAVRFGTAPTRRGVWTKDGFDVDAAVKEVRDAMRSSDESLFLVSIDLDAYPEYSAEHPDEVWRLEDGRPVFGHHVHAQHPVTDTPPKGYWPWISNHSSVWRADTKRNLATFIDALKRSGLSKRIIGFHLAGYHDAQFATRQPDYSPAAAAAFRRRLAAHYGSAAALARAWGRPVAALDAVTPPTLSDAPEWLDPVRDRDRIDYLDFLKRGPFEMLEDLARHVKTCFGKDVIAVRWCMQAFGGTYNSAYDITPFVASDVFDVLVAQSDYSRRAPALATAQRLPLASFRRHGKLYLDEFDYQTYGALVPGDTDPGVVRWGYSWDYPMWASTYRKGAGQYLAANMGFWHFDMDGGWFSPPEIAGDIADVVAFAKKLPAAPFQPSAALVIDEDGLLLHHAPRRYYRQEETLALSEQVHVLAASGIPYDIFLAPDLIRDPSAFARYRTILFAGFYAIDAARRRAIDALATEGRALVFLPNCGLLGGSEAALGFRFAQTPTPADHTIVAEPGFPDDFHGLLLRENLARNLGYPGFRPARTSILEAPGIRAWARYASDRSIAVGERSTGAARFICFCEPGGLSAACFNRIVRESGGYAPVDRTGLLVHMNDAFVSVHCLVPGRYTLKLPRACRATNVKTGQRADADGATVPLELTAGETAWFTLSGR